jgi:hypothetical protein
VLVVERWILARLCNRKFFSLMEFNHAIALLLNDLNARAFKKLHEKQITLSPTRVRQRTDDMASNQHT